MIIGAHMSTSKGLDKVPQASLNIGGNTFQIFPHSPSIWRAKLPDNATAAKFKEKLAESGIKPEDTLVHSGYLINLASPKSEVWEKSVELLDLEIKIVEALGLKYLNFHPGSHLGTGLDEGISRIAKGIDLVLSRNENTEVILLLENVAPKGGNIGSTFNELRRIVEACSYPEKVMITYDTCHGFDAGYDIRSKPAVEKLLEEIDSEVGLDRFVMVHLNDSKYPLGAAKDRHERIGEGYIGNEGFYHFLSNPEILKRPLILETPGKDQEHAEDIKRVKEILGENGDNDD